MKKRWMIVAGLLALALLVPAPGAGSIAGPTAPVRRGDLVQRLLLSGELEAAESVTVTAPNTRIWGLDIAYLVPDGTVVKQGDLVVRFDTSRLEIERLGLEKQREDARVKIAQKETELEMRRQDLLLQQAAAGKTLNVARLYAAIDPLLIPRADSEKYVFDRDKAELELKKAVERLSNLERTAQVELGVVRLAYEQADLSLKKILREIGLLNITAPTSGRISIAEDWRNGRKLQVGDKVWEGQAILDIPDPRTLRVTALVHDADILDLREGTLAGVTLDAAPDRDFRARLGTATEAAKTQQIKNRLKQFRLRVELLERDPALMRPGMTARVCVPITRPGLLLVPRSAVRIDPAGAASVALAGDPGRTVAVTVLDANDREAAVAGDLTPGTRVRLAAAEAGAASPEETEWVAVKRQDLSFTVGGSGVIRADRSIDISPPALPHTWQYKIARMVDEGVPVKKGDFLIQFDPTEISKQLQEESADLDKVDRELQKTQALREDNVKDLELQLEEGKTQREKAENKLREQREFEASLKVQEAEFEADFARRQVEFLEKKLVALKENARLELQLLQEKRQFHQGRVGAYQKALAALEMKSPADGVVVYQTNWNNEKPQVGGSVYMMETLLSIPDLGSLLARGQVAEADAGKIHLGQKVLVTLDAIPEKVFTGVITQVADTFIRPSFDRPVKVLEFSVTLAETDPKRMRPGMAARMSVEVDTFRNVLAVPLAAIHEENGQPFVWVNQGQKAVRRSIRVGRNNGLVAIVETGLREGERVAGRSPAGANGVEAVPSMTAR